MPDFYQVTLFAKDVATLGGFYRDVMGFKVTYPTGDGSLEGEDWVTLDAGTPLLLRFIAVVRLIRVAGRNYRPKSTIWISCARISRIEDSKSTNPSRFRRM